MKARNYRSIRGMLYTRIEYVHGAPQPKITIFDMGNPKADYDVEIVLRAKERALIRDNALESLRINVNKQLEKRIGPNNYHFSIVVQPYHVIRENKMMTGAGADRLQEGMRRAFGKPIGRAAAVDVGQPIAVVRTFDQFASIAKEVLERNKVRIPKSGYVEVKRLKA
ncbi:MAG: 50S ribosomal protein L16 [Candidatus Geothermarchaeota archaeon]